MPPNSYPQQELTSALLSEWADAGRIGARVRDLHANVGVETRSLAMPKERYAQLSGFTEANQVYRTVGLELAEAALSKSLAAAHLDAGALDAIFFTTVTGLSVPTIDALLMNRLPMRRDVKRVPLFGLGCVAGAAGISRMHDYLKGHPMHTAALVAVELCSLTFQRGDHSVPNLIATGLFGDGAAAVVATGADFALKKTGSPSLEVVATRSAFYRDTEGVMGWDIGSHGFQIVLSASVPDMARGPLVDDVHSFLAEHGLTTRDIGTWISHPGGPKVLQAIESGLALKDGELALSWQTLARHGNLSSASVLLVLAETLAHHAKPDGAPVLMLAMGPGFCAELVLLRWRRA